MPDEFRSLIIDADKKQFVLNGVELGIWGVSHAVIIIDGTHVEITYTKNFHTPEEWTDG